MKYSASIHRHDYPRWLLKNPHWIQLVWLWKLTIYPRTKVIRDRILMANKSIQVATIPANSGAYNQSSKYTSNPVTHNEPQPGFTNSNHLNHVQLVDLGAGDGEFSFLWEVNSWILLDKSAQNVEFLNSYALLSRRKFSNFHAEVLDLNDPNPLPHFLYSQSNETEQVGSNQQQFNDFVPVNSVQNERSKKLPFRNTERPVKPVNSSGTVGSRIFTLFSVLPYLDDPYRTLSEIRECMSQNDQLFIYLPVNQNQILPLYRWMFDRFNQYEKLNDRKHIFQTTEFLNQLTSLRFEIQFVQPVYRKWGIISHEINSMTMMCLSHSNWGLKLLGTVLLIITWPFLQLFNKLEAKTPISVAKHNGLYVEVVKSMTFPGT